MKFAKISSLQTLSALLLLTMLTSCQTTQKMARSMRFTDKPTTPSNFYLDKDRVDSVQRVVMMPVHAPDAGLTTESDIDREFMTKLTATQLFEVVPISREDLARRFGQRSFSSATVLSDSLFAYIDDITEADAVVFFDITTYHPFQPIKIGVRGKMITLQEQKIIWAVDEMYDASVRKVSRDAVKYERKYMAQFESSKQHDSILMSPTRFMAYAAESSILTLPENSLSQSF